MKIYQFALLCFIRVAHVSAHGVQVAHCETGNGSLRVFIEHWHGDNGVSNSDTLTLSVDVAGIVTKPTVHSSGHVVNRALADLPGCAPGTIAVADETCAGRSNSYNDWGYWDFAPNSCGQTTTVQLLQGNTWVFTEGCSVLYPTTISVSDNFGCVVPTAAPTTAATTPAPTAAPTAQPTAAPTAQPTAAPSAQPSAQPSFESVSHDVCGNFAVHARTTVTFDGTMSTIHGGDVGVSPGTSITGSYTFDVVAGDESGVALDSSVFATLVTDAHAAAMEVRADGKAMEIEIGGVTFTPGTYRSDSAINFAYGTVVTLDGLNEENPVFLFQAGSTLVTAANTYFDLINGTKAENVHWALGTAATLGANSVLEGSILAGTAITVGENAEVHGCVLAQSAVTFESGGSIMLNHYIGDDSVVNVRHLRH
jgi:hypothetical protein